MYVTSQFVEMAAEFMIAAEQGTSFSQYLLDSKIRPAEIGKSHDDRMRVLHFLESEGSLMVVDDTLVALKSSSPSWLTQAASQGIPEAFDLADKFATSSASGSKFDSAVLEAIGLTGELAFIEYLKAKSNHDLEIVHCSLFDDSLGYDIRTKSPDGHVNYYEVKTSSRPSSAKFAFFLSRNEAAIGAKLENWNIACMRIVQGDAKFAGFLSANHVLPLLPVNQFENAKWSSAEINISSNLLTNDE